jgi:hypothetical protein
MSSTASLWQWGSANNSGAKLQAEPPWDYVRICVVKLNPAHQLITREVQQLSRLEISCQYSYPTTGNTPTVSKVSESSARLFDSPAIISDSVVHPRMAEVAGLALGVPGVLDTLIKTCLEGYRFISTARSADKDFETHRYQFTVEQQRLKDLTTTVAFRIQESTLKTDDVRFLLISSTLIRIAQQFSDFKQLESLYGVQISSSNKSAEKPSKRSWIRKVFGLEESRKDTKCESDAFKTVLTLTDLHLDKNLEMATLQTLEPRLKSVINTYSRLKWAFLDSEKVETLITKLQQYNSNMEKLVDGHNNGMYPR